VSDIYILVLCLQALQQFLTAALQKILADYYKELAINKLYRPLALHTVLKCSKMKLALNIGLVQEDTD
jgi:hypothetical protein